MKSIASIIALAGVAAAANAGNITNSGSVNLYGRNYGITTWNVNSDATGNSAHVFGGESMTFFNGVLYVGDDHDTNQAAGNLVRYTPGPTGNLSSPSPILMGAGPAGTWGPEGITVNNSGSGYGSFTAGTAVQITGVDTRGTDFYGVFNTGSAGSAILNTQGVPAGNNPDDITWVGSLGKFAVVEETGVGDGSRVRFIDGVTLANGATSPIIDGAKGIVTVSQAFARSLTGLNVTTSEALFVISEFEGLRLYDTAGNAIGGEISLSAYLNLITNETESIAVDEANNLIFFGDEAGKAVHVVTVPAPTAAALLGLGGLLAARRRRA